MRLGLVQMAMAADAETNIRRAEEFLREAKGKGAELVLLPELFSGPYFCQDQREEYLAWAQAVEGHSFLPRFQKLAQELQLYLPISFYERRSQAHFNSLAWITPQGELAGVYRKTHIPDGPGYQEKYYFNPGDSGFHPWPTPWGKVGTAICWDQWFPEAARCLVLEGAELLLYPTAIGSEPPPIELDTRSMWRRAMIGHAVSNSCFVGAANRVGQEGGARFYGTSFVADYRGEILCEADEREETVLTAEIDLKASQAFRAAMGFFRDRRPEHYRRILEL